MKMDGAEVISLYEAVSRLTDQMLAAARDEDWILMSKLEADCSFYVDMLRKNEADVILTDSARDRKIEILKKILEDDKNIRNLADPALKRLSSMIKNTGTELKLAKAYGMNQRG